LLGPEPQLPEAVQPGDGPLRHPTEHPQATAVLRVPLGEQDAVPQLLKARPCSHVSSLRGDTKLTLADAALLKEGVLLLAAAILLLWARARPGGPTPLPRRMQLTGRAREVEVR